MHHLRSINASSPASRHHACRPLQRSHSRHASLGNGGGPQGVPDQHRIPAALSCDCRTEQVSERQGDQLGQGSRRLPRARRRQALMRTQRTSCLDSMDALEALADFPEQQAKCVAAAARATGATTTGTTATGTTTTSCRFGLDPDDHLPEPALSGPRALRRSDLQHPTRQPASRQWLVASPAPASQRWRRRPPTSKKERLFASSAAKLAHDVTVLIKVTKGQAPSSDLNQTPDRRRRREVRELRHARSLANMDRRSSRLARMRE